MSTTPTILTFDSSTLLGYYQAKLSLALANKTSSATSSSTSSTSATANDSPPWSSTGSTSTEAKDAEVLALTDYLDTNNVPRLSGVTADSKTEQDNQKLFSLYTALQNLTYLAKMAKRDDMTSGQLTGFNKRFQTALSQIKSYISDTSFNNFTLQAAASSSSVTSTISVPLSTFGYTGGSVVSYNNRNSTVSGASSSDSFTVSVTKGGTATDVLIDLSQVQGDLTLGNIVSYVNQQLSDAGFSTRFKCVLTKGSLSDTDTASYGIKISDAAGESVALSSAGATPSLYLAGVTGLTTATSKSDQDNQGRLVKLSNLSDPTSTFSATTKPTNGTTTAKSTVVDSDGNVYVLGNATGDFGNQLNQGSQDVCLSKYDSAGNLLWTKLLGSAGTASGYALAVDPAGGVVVAGSTTADLTIGAVADGNTDSFVAKYDSNGNQTWTTQIQTIADNQAVSVSVDAAGNVYVGGQVRGVIGAGQTKSGGDDAYLAKFDSGGNLVSERQFGTSGNDTVSATALTAGGDLIVASVQNGHAILAKYAGGDVTSDPVWQEDLGDLGSTGSIGGIAVAGDQIYLSGSTTNSSLTADGEATIANASSGGSDAFVFSATDNGDGVSSNYVSYVGTGASDKGGSLAVGSDGTVYLAGTTKGTFSGQTRSVNDTNNAFVTSMSSDGTINWTKQYGGLNGQSTGVSLAIDETGSSVLDALGLARGMIAKSQLSVTLSSATTLRAGDSFQIKLDGTTDRTVTITIDEGETLRSLVKKLNGKLGSNGTASVSYGSGGKSLKIAISSGVTATLISGPTDSDALARLGIATATLTDGTSSSTTSSSASTVYGLGLAAKMDISTKTSAAAVVAQLSSVLTAIKNIYQKTNTSASSSNASTTNSSSSAVSSYLQSQLSNYSAALSILS